MNLTPVLFVFIGSFAYSQDCTVLNQLRDHARSNFSTIAPKITSHPAKVKSTLLLPNAQSCTIQTYSYVEAKYTCEWALVKEQEKEDLALSIYDAFVNDLAFCAGSKSKIDRRYSDKKNIERSAKFIDSEFKNSKREIFIIINLDYFSHWWAMTMEYSINNKDE